MMRQAMKTVDVIITTGGVSMGEKDYIKSLIERTLNGTIKFGRVALKPGKPTTFATIPGKNGKPVLFFGLAGNPVSAFGNNYIFNFIISVTFHLFVLPCLNKMSRIKNPEPIRVMVNFLYFVFL